MRAKRLLLLYLLPTLLFGAADSLSITITIQDVVALDGEVMPTEFVVQAPYPNPVNGIVMLPMELPGSGVVEITLYDILGKKIMKRKILQVSPGNIRETLDLSNYPSGTYFLQTRYSDTSTGFIITLLK